MASIYYTEVDLSPYEVPNEQSLCIYIQDVSKSVRIVTIQI